MCRILRFLLNRKPFPRYAFRANGLGKTITNALPLWVIFILSPFCCGADIYVEGITPDFVNLLMLAVCPVFWIVTAPTFRCHRLDGLFLVFIVWQGVCLPCGGAFDRWSAIRLASYILLYAYVRNSVERKPLFLCLFCAGLLQGLWGILQAETILPARHYLFSMTGCFSNPAPWGIFLTLSLLSGLSLYSKNFSVPVKILWGSGVLFLLLCIFLSASRASWIALLGGSYWLLPSSLRQHLGRRLKATWWKSSAAARILIPVSALLPTCLLLYSLYALRSDSVSGRLLIWQVIGSGLSGSPWLGHGPLPASYMPMQAVWLQAHSDSPLARLADNNLHAFNELLRITYESGFIGLLLFIGLLTQAVLSLRRHTASTRTAGALLTALMIAGLFSYPFTTPPIAMTGIAALALIPCDAGRKQYLAFRPSRLVRIGCCLAVVLFMAFAIGEYRLEKRADRLLINAQQDPALLTAGNTLPLMHKLRNNADFMLACGKTLFDGQYYAEALPVLERGARLKPSSPLLCDLGECYRHARQYSLAGQAFTEAARMTPAHILPQYRLFRLYLETGSTAEAEAKARHMLRMQVKVVNTSVLRYRREARNYLKQNDR